MSRGNPRVTVRVQQSLLDEIQQEIESQAEHSARGPEDVSLFIVRAIRERIAHRKRSRAHRRAHQGSASEAWPDEIVCLALPPGALWI